MRKFSHDFLSPFLHLKFFHMLFLGCQLLDSCCVVFTCSSNYPGLLPYLQPFTIIVTYCSKYFIVWHIILFWPSFNILIQGIVLVISLFIDYSYGVRIRRIGRVICHFFVVFYHPHFLDFNIDANDIYYLSK